MSINLAATSLLVLRKCTLMAKEARSQTSPNPDPKKAETGDAGKTE
jgi:hypothetical protein